MYRVKFLLFCFSLAVKLFFCDEQTVFNSSICDGCLPPLTSYQVLTSFIRLYCHLVRELPIAKLFTATGWLESSLYRDLLLLPILPYICKQWWYMVCLRLVTSYPFKRQFLCYIVMGSFLLRDYSYYHVLYVQKAHIGKVSSENEF